MTQLQTAFTQARQWIAQGIDEENIVEALSSLDGIDPQAVYRLATGWRWTWKQCGAWHAVAWIAPQHTQTPAPI